MAKLIRLVLKKLKIIKSIKKQALIFLKGFKD
jgi:hypothetical protein